MDTTKLDSIPKKRYKLLGVPLFFYVPETKFGGGAAGIVTYNLKKDAPNARASSVQFGVAFTQLKQTLIYLPFNLWFTQNKYNVYGEVGYYKYNFFFWGVGNKQESNLKERYDVNFPRVKLNVLREVKPNLFVGLRYNFDDFRITGVQENGLLAGNTIIGNKGGIVSSLGAVVKLDSRDNLFYPTKGNYLELAYQVDDKRIGSSFNNTRLFLDYSGYQTFKKRHTLAYNMYAVKGNGTIPFNQLALLGGTKKMRGFYEGRYRDKNLILVQGEYRVVVYKRFGAVAFMSVGDVSDEVKNFKINSFKVAYGTGLRYVLDKKQRINVRLDYGWAEPKPNFYLTVTEAF